MKPRRVAILGGTFDPIHLGHLVAAQYAFHHLQADRLVLVPSASPVHRPRHRPADPKHRLRMCQLAALSLPPFTVSDAEVARDEPSFTVITLQRLAATFAPGTTLFLLVGEDNVPLLHTWKDYREILRLSSLVPMPRPVDPRADLGPLRDAVGPDAVDAILARRVPAPLVPLSSTDLRARIRSGASVAGLVPASVAAYIAANGLYAATATGA